jgi:hypothetical protein
MKSQSFKLIASMLLVALTGCSNNGKVLAKASEAHAECTLAGQSKCVKTLSEGPQLTANPATLFANNDSVRVESVLQQANECIAFAKEAGSGRNTAVTVNDSVVKMYGDERPGGIDLACKGPAPFRVAVTVAKTS